MPKKEWTFTLDGQSHSVVLEYSYFSAQEKFWVDGVLLVNEARWTFDSHYDFSIGEHQCHAELKTGMSYSLALTVDGQSVETLPSQILLRPSQASDPNALLRPHHKPNTTASSELLRPSEEEKG